MRQSFEESNMNDIVCFEKSIRVKVVNTLPNMLGLCDLKLGSIVKIDAIRRLGDISYYHLEGKHQDAWYDKERFSSVK